MLTWNRLDFVEGQRHQLRGEVHSGREECPILADVAPEGGLTSS